MTEEKRKYDLEPRLIKFSVLIISISEKVYKTKAGSHLAGQLVRSGTAPALNYGEAQSAESRADFIHKIKVILKELRETRITLLLIKDVPLTNEIELVDHGLIENNELISIFRKSAETAMRNISR